MKNNLYEKYQSPKVDDNANPNKGIPIRAEEPDEPNKFVQFIKYAVIIGSCLLIPFYMNSNSDDIDEIVTEVKGGIEEATGASRISASSNADELPAFVSSILSKALWELRKASNDPNLDGPEREKLKEAIAKIEAKMNIGLESNQTDVNEAAKIAIQDALAGLDVQIDGFDEDELNIVIHNSISSALEGLNSLSQLENLNDLKNLKPTRPNQPPVPPVPGVSNSKREKLDIPYVDYLAELKENGLFNTYKEYELKSFYENGIDIDQIEEWKEGGLTDLLKPWELIQLNDKGVDASDIEPWIKAGFLKDYKSFEIVQFIENDVPTSYVSDFKKNGFDKKFQFYEITNFFNADVTIDNLKDWDKSGYLNLFKSHEIVSFIENDVPPSFLKSLDQKGLLKDLQFYEITNLFNESDN
jgi:hypothetical protein